MNSAITQVGLTPPKFLRSFRMDLFGFGSCINQVSPTKSNNSESELHKMHIQFNSRSSDIQEQHVPVKKRRPAYFLDFNDEKKKLDTLLKNTELPIQSSSHF